MRPSRPRLATTLVAIVAACLLAPGAVAREGPGPRLPETGHGRARAQLLDRHAREGRRRRAGRRRSQSVPAARPGSSTSTPCTASSSRARRRPQRRSRATRNVAVGRGRPPDLPDRDRAVRHLARPRLELRRARREGAYQAGYTRRAARASPSSTPASTWTTPTSSRNIDAGVEPELPGHRPTPPEDGHGHGTHVSGTAAAPLNGEGVVGHRAGGAARRDQDVRRRRQLVRGAVALRARLGDGPQHGRQRRPTTSTSRA